MPFTLAHPAAVLPLYTLSKSRLPLSALMIGSMAPDFSYFTPYNAALATHSIAGLFWFCWPMGLVAWLIFVYVLERPTIAMLPERWRAGSSPAAGSITASLLARASIAIVVGASTHIIWDSFTHATPVTAAIPQLRSVVLQFGQSPVRLYKVLQHASTIVGLAVLLFWTRARLEERRSIPSNNVHVGVSNAMRAGTVALVLVSACAAAVVNYALHPHIRLERRLFHLAIGGMAGWAVAWTSIAALLMWRWRMSREQVQRTEPSAARVLDASPQTSRRSVSQISAVGNQT